MAQKSENLIISAVVGSVAYGLNTASSDVDVKSIYVMPTREVLKLGFNIQHTTIQKTDPDITSYEVGRYMELAAKCNPTCLELMYLNDYSILTPIGQKLIDNRDAFLSTKAVSNAYRGYAMSQAHKLNTRIEQGLEGYDSALKNRFAKHSRHLRRLLTQAEQLLTTGTLNVRLTDQQVKDCFAFGELQTQAVIDGFFEMDSRVKGLEAQSVLPSAPDYDKLNEILYEIRMAN